MTVLTVEDLRKHYESDAGLAGMLGGSSDPVRAVNGVSLSIEAGESLGVVGESGCGKSTLARTIIGLEEPTDGSVIFKGETMAGASRSELTSMRKDLQMVFQDPGSSLNPRKLVRNIVGDPLTIHEDIRGRELDDRVTELLRQTGLKEEHLYRYPTELSGGQRQRVAIARALSLSPEMIIFDEPTSALDMSVQAEILNLLGRLKQEHGFASLVISHDLSVIRHVCDRLVVMYLGEIVERGRAEDVLSNPKHPYTRSLASSIPEPDPDARFDPAELAGEIPDPSNLPSGCQFHTRCPELIPPDGLDVDQGAWVAVHRLKRRIESRELDVGDRSVAALRDHLLPVDRLGETAEDVDQALEAAVSGRWEEAEAALADYNSICESSEPEIHTFDDIDSEALCHLHKKDV
jgi:peptide/nickel transport system ATP-binding protein